MSKPLFIHSPLCQSRTVCEACIDAMRGPKFRAGWLASYELPATAEAGKCMRPGGPFSLPIASNEEIERLLARDRAEGGCGCDGSHG